MFRFRLEAALKFRARVVEKNQRGMAEVNNVYQEETEKLENLLVKRESNLDNYSDGLTQLKVQEMIFFDTYFAGNRVEIQKQKVVVAKALEKLEEKRAILSEAVKQKKIIETVKKKAIETFKKEERKKEEAMLNDVSMTRYNHA